MAPNRGPQVMAVIPAHNESARISIAIKSLLSQQTPPESIVVLADNCTDATAEVARDMGAQVFKTEGNQHKKAGALNQLLGSVLPGLDEDDRVLIMDADTELAPEFLYVANGRLDSFAELGAVGGIFYGEPGSGLVGLLQRNEYLRYGRDINRHPNRVMVLTGTASLLRVKALREVAAARGSRLPGRPGTVYDTAALTEDNEITLALKTIGWKLVSPRQCRVTTESDADLASVMAAAATVAARSCREPSALRVDQDHPPVLGTASLDYARDPAAPVIRLADRNFGVGDRFVPREPVLVEHRRHLRVGTARHRVARQMDQPDRGPAISD